MRWTGAMGIGKKKGLEWTNGALNKMVLLHSVPMDVDMDGRERCTSLVG